MVKYSMNLVKSIRVAEKRGAKHFVNMVLLTLVCFGILGASGYYVYLQIDGMERVISAERQMLRRLEAEFRNYQETQSTVEKADIELLNELLASRVYWTKVLEAMANYLPHEEPISYWITKFGYAESPRTYTVKGYGYITERQEQLMALDEYLNSLRADPDYSAIFGVTYLVSAVREDETDAANNALHERVNFEYASLRKGMTRTR